MKTYIGDIADSVCVTTRAYIFIIIIRQTYIQTYRRSVGEALAHAVNKIILKSCENLNQVTKSHVIYIRYCKSHAPCLNM